MALITRISKGFKSSVTGKELKTKYIFIIHNIMSQMGKKM